MTEIATTGALNDPILDMLKTQGQPGMLEDYVKKTYGSESAAAAKYNAQGGIGGSNGGLDVANPMTGMDKFNMGLDIFKTGLGAYSALEANKLATKQFDFTKQAYETNLANQTTVMNKAVADDYNRGNAWKPGSLGTQDQHMAKWGAVA